ncbi:OLC1v1015273C1 [Oldenlandia corymbosa var. corymbosa]|uniref:OLC1v1015273C1 n=1 Tax=Oldenlandia corymbosa var. corymbosa TaxID=529605 RepID=A0AAV1E2X6_OLDCO|nr:OLC1v1015273C1 [Oldenlandia corymbosa var. corymbosa]
MGQEKKTMWRVTVWLTLIWALSILYGEMFAFWVPPLLTCSWPHQVNELDSSELNGDFVKIAIIADPQIMDRTSHHLPSLVLEIAEFYSDLFMRRAFLSSILSFKPDAILFLGDYMDGGPYLSDDEWQESLSRFKHIFNLNMLQQNTNTKVYFLSGNHDVGYAAVLSKMPEVTRRYEKEFGARNYRFKLGQVDFVTIDSQTLDGNAQEDVTATTWKFISNVSEDPSSTSRVLLTHIPLYRPNETSCGPYRASSIINQRITRSPGDQQILYQNYVTEKSSNNVLNSIRPALILSGHDHDQCTVTHMAKHGPVKEHTVGTVSWQQGNLFPSFMLLSVSNRSFPEGIAPEDVISTKLCFLPFQTFIYIWYLILFVITLIAALFWQATDGFISHIFGNFRECIRSLLSLTVFGGIEKEKNEDENCEYEILWDADGSIHMMKKASKAPPKSATDRASAERGNAVMRATAKRPSGQEADGLAMTGDVSVNVGLLETTMTPARAKKSKWTSVVRRLLCAFRIVALVAVVNVPLYMMLLFKDWIDK